MEPKPGNDGAVPSARSNDGSGGAALERRPSSGVVVQRADPDRRARLDASNTPRKIVRFVIRLGFATVLLGIQAAALSWALRVPSFGSALVLLLAVAVLPAVRRCRR